MVIVRAAVGDGSVLPDGFHGLGRRLLTEEGMIGQTFGSAIDFAGGTVVHISAGAAGLVLALIIGKRHGFSTGAAALAVGLKYRLGFDDSLDVVGVHLAAGLVGTIAVGFIALPDDGERGGLLYGGGVDQLIAQLAVVVAMVFTAGVTAIIGFAIHRTVGFRVSHENEIAGVDVAEHAESAYDLAPDQEYAEVSTRGDDKARIPVT